MIEIELEKTYLAKYLPDDIKKFPSKEIKDIYLPKKSHHPVLRIRKNGDNYQMTKKEPITGNDSSEQTEHTIKLSKDEFAALEKLSGKEVRKIRYYYKQRDRTYEIDVFKDALAGLVLVDVEFINKKDKDVFEMPDFCSAEVTQEVSFAGGMLAGKKYKDLEKALKKYKYKKISPKA
jgi:CYTH domain-containing protein